MAVFPGNAKGARGYRGGLRGQRRRIVPLAAASVVVDIVGVGLIPASSEAAFEGGRAGARERPGVGALDGQALAAAYGGCFGAALGVAVLALLGLSLDDTLQRLNALKALLQLVIDAVAAPCFALLTPVAWGAAAVVGAASLAGGKVGARLAGRAGERPRAARGHLGLRGRRLRLALRAVGAADHSLRADRGRGGLRREGMRSC